MAVADEEVIVRRAVLEALQPRLEPFLAKADVLKQIFVCLRDSNLDNQIIVVQLLRYVPHWMCVLALCSCLCYCAPAGCRTATRRTCHRSCADS